MCRQWLVACGALMVLGGCSDNPNPPPSSPTPVATATQDPVIVDPTATLPPSPTPGAPSPTPSPTAAPTQEPTEEPTPAPTPEVTPAPTPASTDAPTPAPTLAPTLAPTAPPTASQTAAPATPTQAPATPTAEEVVVDNDEDGAPATEDCDDDDAAIHPGADELCDAIDNDCDGLIDDDDVVVGAPTWYLDFDGDGYGTDSFTLVQCEQPRGYVSTLGDCDDADPAFNPGAQETSCSDQSDYNCDGSTGFTDADDDGYAACQECDDTDPAVHPDAQERCDGIDNDCDGDIDDEDSPVSGTSTFYPDADGDGYGAQSGATAACEAPEGYVTQAGDCDDSNGSLNPETVWYLDFDKDGYGSEDFSLTQCAQPRGYVAAAGDCNDASSAYYPGAPEENCADPNDYNCDGSVGYADADDDGFASCEECDDQDAQINPAAPEQCNGADDDCDGELDEGVTFTWYEDLDNDGYGGESSTEACERPAGYVGEQGDCDDTSAEIQPDADEICDALDNDCDGRVDSADPDLTGAPIWYIDYDQDGYGSAAYTTDACEEPAGYVDNQGDCKDIDAQIHPDAEERCNLQDDNCNGEIDEGVPAAITWYEDVDGDGFGDEGSTVQACSQPLGYVVSGGDCNDDDEDAFPGATESCDGTDQNCNGETDDGALGTSAACAAASCEEVLADNPDAPSGLYQVVLGSATVPVYCYMAPDGAWTMILQASSSSAYTFTHRVWTDTSPATTTQVDPAVDQDAVSPAFYALKGRESMVCMNDLDHCVRWRHAENTARALVNGTRASTAQANARNCTTDHCGPNSYPEELRSLTPGSGAWTYHRFGYVNDRNDWGGAARVGFSGDGDTSDSSDTTIGLGLDCTASCTSGSTTGGPHGKGAGYYLYNGWGTAPLDGPMKGMLFIRSSGPEFCGDGIDNDRDGTVDEGVIGSSALCPAQDCNAIKIGQPAAASGTYWLDSGAAQAPFQAYCDMSTDGGGWTLALQASSASAYTYSHVAWTRFSSADLPAPLEPGADRDGASQAFYAAPAVESRLCMGDLNHCVIWSHAEGIPRDLANGARAPGAYDGHELCADTRCGPNTLPTRLNEATSGSSSSTWHRFGYVNDVNGWGTATRIGFTGDGDTSDSSDSIIGLGLSCTSNCTTGSATSGPHGMGAGFYLYQGWAATPLDGPLKAWLFTRSRWDARTYAGETCGDTLDNDGDGAVDEGTLGASPGCAALDCLELLAERPGIPSGQYWLDPGARGKPTQGYCDMTTNGGGWTLVLQSSFVSPFVYSHPVWTLTTASSGYVQRTDPVVNQDAVSPAFYSYTGDESMLCMGSLARCNAWTHAAGTARNLANGSRLASAQGSASVCTTFLCGANTLPSQMRDAAGGTTASTWHRWGYVNDVNGWGTSTRVGFTGDGDSSDSSDTVIGLGLACTANCPAGSSTSGAHGTGSGYYKYNAWATTPYDLALEGFLFVR